MQIKKNVIAIFFCKLVLDVIMLVLQALLIFQFVKRKLYKITKNLCLPFEKVNLYTLFGLLNDKIYIDYKYYFVY